MAGRGGCSLQSSVLAISVLYLLVLGLLLALAAVLALDPGPGRAPRSSANVSPAEMSETC